MGWLTTIFSAVGKPFRWWVVVAPWERGLRVRMGKSARLLEPGIHFRIPFLDRVYVQSTRLRTAYDTCITVSTLDGHTVIIGVATNFCVNDIRALFDSLAAPETTLKTRVAAAVVDYVSQRKRDDVTPTELERSVSHAISSFGCGLSGIGVQVISFAFVRTYRLMMNDYSIGAGLYHDFDRMPESQR